MVAERVDRAVLERFPNLKLVANYGAGYDLVDVDACRERGVAVTNTPGVTAAATADLTMGLILAVRRRIAAGDRVVRSGRWGSGWADEPLKGDEVSGATLGIVGLGRIGQRGRAAGARRSKCECSTRAAGPTTTRRTGRWTSCSAKPTSSRSTSR